MSKKVTKVSVFKDGRWSDPVDIGVKAQNVIMADGKTVNDKLDKDGKIDKTKVGSIKEYPIKDEDTQKYLAPTAADIEIQDTDTMKDAMGKIKAMQGRLKGLAKLTYNPTSEDYTLSF